MSADVATSRSIPRRTLAVFGSLAALGAITFLVGIAGDSSERTYRVFLHNWLMWAALAQGALVLSCAMRLTNANWQGPIHRVVDSMGAYVPLTFVLFLVVYIGRHELFEWTHQEVVGKEWWYQPGFVFTRDTIALFWMTGMSILYLYLSVRPMLGAAREHGGRFAGLYARWTSGWRGEERERELAVRRLRKMSAVLILSYAICYSLLAMDMIMSLSPEWVSTLFPVYFGWGGFLSAISLLTLICLFMRNSDELRDEITVNRRHDLGKMIFAFSIFWMYLFWSQYFVIWYANIPEETGFIVDRLGSQFVQDTWYMAGFWERISASSAPYAKLTLSAWFLVWVIPFWVLLGAGPKKAPAILGTVAAGSVLGFWIERYVLVTPSLVSPAKVLAGDPVTPFSVIELGIGLGFLGLFFLCFFGFARVFPGALPAKS
ncbi:MAG: hypothetical protein V3V67_19245 [Myxococcota bacterium]